MEAAERTMPAQSDGSHKLGRGVEKASAGAHSAIDKFSDVARPAVDRMASGAHGAVDKMAGVAGQAADSLNARGEQIKDVSSRVMDQTRGYIRNNPMTSLGIAAAAGFLLSRLLRSR